MKSKIKPALVGRLGIGVAAVLLTILGMATAVSAQESNPSVEITYIGWAADEQPTGNAARDLDRAFGVVTNSIRSWDCSDRRCHYVRVDFSGIAPKPNIQKVDGVNDGPGWNLTVTREHPDRNAVRLMSKDVGVDEAGGGNGPYTYYVAVPWAGERVWVTLKGEDLESNKSDSAVIPAHVPAAFRTRSPLVASTLVDWEENSSTLPMLLTVWPKTVGATRYDLQYVFRGDLHQGSTGNYSQVVTTRLVTASQKRGLYERLGADWSRHAQRAILGALTNDDFDSEDAGWIFVTTPLPKLVSGAEGWPQAEIVEDDITAALEAGAGKARIGVRVQPVLDCSLADSFAPDLTEFCSAGTYALDTLSLRGKKSQVSYKTVRLSDLE